MNIFIFLSIYTTFISFLEKLLKREKNKHLFLLLLFIPLLIVSWRRGNTTVDYGNYEYFFMASKNLSFFTGFQSLGIEPGYFLLNKIVSLISSNFTTFLFFFSTIILSIYYYFFYKFSQFYGMSMLLLIAFGSYYTSFNTMRQFLAASICIIGVINIKKGFFKYSLIIILAASIHYTALVMIPFYFLLQFNLSNFKEFTIFSFLVSLFFVIYIFSPEIVKFITSFSYTDYSVIGAFGISTGTPLISLTRFIFLLGYSLLFVKLINFNNINEVIGFNSIIITLVFMLFSTRIELFQRFSYFFMPYMTVFIPNLTSKLKNKNTRLFFNSLIFIICVGYVLITQNKLLYIWK